MALGLLVAAAVPALDQCPLYFVPAANYVPGDNPWSFAVGDFNADGRPDLAVANVNSDNVSVFLNTVAGFPPPAIIQQPAASQIVAAGQNAALAITANGFGNTLTYQWRKDGTPLASGGNISGATSPTLTFTPALLSDFASYAVQVTAPPSCGGGAQVTTTAAGILGVTGTACIGDTDGDGDTDSDDIIAFFAAWDAGC